MSQSITGPNPTGPGASGEPLGNRPALEELSYRIGTHASFMAEMAARTRSASVPGLERLEPGIGAQTAIFDVWASICDVLTFYQERIANEGFLRTATERRSILEMARLTGYRLRPGVAAGVYLAFTAEADGTARIPPGTRVQTVPGPGEEARTFELIEGLTARADWNALQPRRTRPIRPNPSIERFCVSGGGSGLRPGDPVLTLFNDAHTLRRVDSVLAQFERGRTVVTLMPNEPAPGSSTPTPAAQGSGQAGTTPPPQADYRRPANALQLLRDPNLLFAPFAETVMRLRGTSPMAEAATNHDGAAGPQIFALPIRSAPFGSIAPRPSEHAGGKVTTWHEWDLRGAEGKDDAARENPTTLYLETAHTDILPGSWIAFDGPQEISVPPPCRVRSVATVVRAAYGIAGRCTRLELDAPWIDPDRESFAKLRNLTVYAGSTALTLADDDITESLAPTGRIELDGYHAGLSPGRWLLIEGDFADLPGSGGEVAMLAGSEHSPSQPVHTTLVLAAPTTHSYRRDSVRIWGNVARATEGESVAEVIGSGDGGASGQTARLHKLPLTYVSAATSSGVASTLDVQVNGVHWHEVDNLTLAGPADRVFVTEVSDDDRVTVRFGNGVQGARVPTGVENIHAFYRTGIGAGGNCAAGQISMLLSRPLGVRAVTNPLPASGGADRESRDRARRNVPVGLIALDRLVGIADYADFARAFAGVGKAQAVHVFGPDGPSVLVTVAGRDGVPIGADADLLRHLRNALAGYGDPTQAIIVRPARRLRAVIVARIGLDPDMTWEAVAPPLRAALLDRLGFERRDLGRPLRRSEVVATMQAVPGVAYVMLDVLTALADPVSDASFAALRRGGLVTDILAHPGGLGRDPESGRRRALPADLAYVSGDVGDLILLSEAER